MTHFKNIKYVIFLSSFIFSPVSPQPFLDHQEAAQKQKKIDLGDEGRELSTKSFFLSLSSIRNSPVLDTKIGPVDEGIPYIGYYHSTSPGNPGEHYAFRSLLGAIEMNPEMLCRLQTIENWPPLLINQLKQLFHADSCENLMAPGRVTFLIEFTGTMPDLYTQPSNNTYNMVFHPVLSVWLSNRASFNVSVTMGIFNAKVLSQGDIPFNTVTPISVNLHGSDVGLAFSPDNAKITFLNQPISTFWSLAYYNNQACVTFHIVANTLEMEETLQNLLWISRTLAKLQENLSLQENIGLQQTAEIIKTALGITKQEQEKKEMKEKKPQTSDHLPRLQNQFDNLYEDFQILEATLKSLK